MSGSSLCCGEYSFSPSLTGHTWQRAKKGSVTESTGKPGGRNELIGDFIFRWTGQRRTRKQISSHLQVLKDYLKTNKACKHPLDQHLDFISLNRFEGMELLSPEFWDTVLEQSRLNSVNERSSYKAPLPPDSDCWDSAPSKLSPPNFPSVKEIKFEMLLEDRKAHRLHTFTSMQNKFGLFPSSFDEMLEKGKYLPHLDTYYHGQKPIDYELIMLETKVDLIRHQFPSGSQIRIEPFIIVAGGRNYRDWHFCTRFFENGFRIRDGRNGIHLVEKAQTLPVRYSGDTSEIELELQMQSRWWSQNIIAEIHNRVMLARRHETPSPVYQAEQWGRQYLANLSVTQEIWAFPCDGKSAEMATVLLWKFQQTEPGEAGIMTWRKLTPSPAQTQVEAYPYASPTLSSPSSHLALQGELKSKSSLDSEEFLRQPSLFVENAESIMISSELSEGYITPEWQSLSSGTAPSSGFESNPHRHHGACPQPANGYPKCDHFVFHESRSQDPTNQMQHQKYKSPKMCTNSFPRGNSTNLALTTRNYECSNLADLHHPLHLDYPFLQMRKQEEAISQDLVEKRKRIFCGIQQQSLTRQDVFGDVPRASYAQTSGENLATWKPA